MASTCVAWGIAAYLSFVDTRKEIDGFFDAHLAESARAILEQAGHEQRERHDRRRDDDDEGEGEEEHDGFNIPALKGRGQLFEKRLYFQLWDSSHNLIINSRRHGPAQALFATWDEGFFTGDLQGEEVRVFAAWNKKRTYYVQVAESVKTRAALAHASIKRVLSPILLMIVPLLLLIALAVEYALRTMKRLSSELQKRTADDLAPLASTGIPKELLPLVEALNALFSRLSRALANERRFTADAAHELRTPLAAIKIQAQVALRSAGQDEIRNRALEGIDKGIDRATHLVEQLLTLARLDPETELPGEVLRLRPLVVNMVGMLAPSAVAKDLEVAVLPGPEPVIHGNRAMLEVLVRNLVDNAIRYTPSQGYVHVSVNEHEGACQLSVEDNGPGLSDEQKKLVMGRFSRISRPSGDGSGLGLSIVERIASLHRARLILETGSAGHGLRVQVLFPSVPVATRA